MIPIHIATESGDLIRTGWSFDFDDIAAILLALAALITVFVAKRTESKTDSTTRDTTEIVDATVLGQFRQVFESRIAALEAQIVDLQQQLGALRQLEGALERQLERRDAEIASLRVELTVADARIAHLESVLRNNGVPREEWNGVERRADGG